MSDNKFEIFVGNQGLDDAFIASWSKFARKNIKDVYPTAQLTFNAAETRVVGSSACRPLRRQYLNHT